MTRDIIWDFDGTLVDTYPAIASAVNGALAQFGQAIPSELCIELTSISLAHCMTELAGRFAIPLAEFESAFWPVYRQISPGDQPPFPDVVRVCAAVQERGRNFIVTHRRRESLMQLLRAHAMAELFTGIVAGDDGFPRKPDPAAFLHLIDAYGIDRATALAVGDRDIDVLAGQRAGLKTCLYRATFPGCAPDHQIASYTELLTVLAL